MKAVFSSIPRFFVIFFVVSLSISLSACNVKEGAKEVGDAGNDLAKTIGDTINRENVKKDE